MKHEQDVEPEQWCKHFRAHSIGHDFCVGHQSSWCRICSRCCPECADDPLCPECGCHLHEDPHDWDCCSADDNDSGQGQARD